MMQDIQRLSGRVGQRFAMPTQLVDFSLIRFDGVLLAIERLNSHQTYSYQ